VTTSSEASFLDYVERPFLVLTVTPDVHISITSNQDSHHGILTSLIHPAQLVSCNRAGRAAKEFGWGMKPRTKEVGTLSMPHVSTDLLSTFVP
jgi:hypothetical protein